MLERKIDDIGRLLIPADIRKTIGIEPGDKVCLSIQDKEIIIRKVATEKQCKMCHKTISDPHEIYMGICAVCEEELKQKMKLARVS